MIRIAALTIIVSILGFQTYAAQVSGFIQRNNKNSIFLILKDSSKKVSILPASQIVEDDLQKLNDGDFLMGQGTLSRDKLTLKNVDFVGLQQILGSWESLSSEVFNFIDFSNLILEVPFSESESETSQFQLEYTVSPSSGSSWALFLTDRQSVVYGDLEIADRKILIRFFNPKTGETIKSLSLRAKKQ